MNFIASSTTLLRHLQSISGVLNTSNTLPILDNFLFEITDGMLTVSISDLETTMMTKLEVQSEQNGKIAIPAKLLLDVLKNLPDQPCTFKVNPTNFQIEIAYDNGKSRVMDGDHPYWSWTRVHAHDVQTNRVTRLEQVKEVVGGYRSEANIPDAYDRFLTKGALRRLGS